MATEKQETFAQVVDRALAEVSRNYAGVERVAVAAGARAAVGRAVEIIEYYEANVLEGENRSEAMIACKHLKRRLRSFMGGDDAK